MSWIQEDHERLEKLKALRAQMMDLVWMDAAYLGTEEMKIYKDIIDMQTKTAIYWMQRALDAEKVVRAYNSVLWYKFN
jgi:hypothetical protein